MVKTTQIAREALENRSSIHEFDSKPFNLAQNLILIVSPNFSSDAPEDYLRWSTLQNYRNQNRVVLECTVFSNTNHFYEHEIATF